MRDYVSKMREQGLPGNIFIRPNRPKPGPDGQRLKEVVTKAWQELVDAGMAKTDILANPRNGHIWKVGLEGAVDLLGKVVDGRVQWEEIAPEQVRSARA
eukprot:9013592-Karenia_brevis.AAC.2